MLGKARKQANASVKKQVYLGSWKEGLWSLFGARGRNRGGDWGLRISCGVAEVAREIFF